MLRYVEDFTNSTFNLMTGHMQGKDLTIPILKEIAQRHNTKAPVSLVKLQDTSKAFLFEYHGNMVSGTKQHTMTKAAKLDQICLRLSFTMRTCHPPSGQLYCSLSSHYPNTMGAF